MKRINLKHISIHFRKNCLPAITVVLMSLLTVACGGKTEDEPDPGRTDGRTDLLISTRAVDGAKAGSSNNDKEIMHNLRVIILDSEGKIEINDYIRFDTPQDSFSKLYKIKPSENKTVYLIANETSILNNGTGATFSSELNGYTVGSTGIGSLIENKTFNMDLATPAPLPMSSKYELSASDIPPNQKVYETFYLVRTVCKFDVSFTNSRLTDLTFDNFSINNVATGAGYLTAHLDNGAGIYKWVEDYYMEPNLRKGEWNAFGKSWIDWMKIAVEETKLNPSDTDLADRRGWIMQYSIPEKANPNSQDLLKGIPSAFTLKPSEKKDFPTFYCHESRQLMEGISNFTQNNSLEQQYFFYLILTDESGDERKYNQKIPNLRALFRNTHVVINIDITSTGLWMMVDVVPYAEKILEPNFGLD